MSKIIRKIFYRSTRETLDIQTRTFYPSEIKYGLCKTLFKIPRPGLPLERMKMILENKRSVLQKYSGSQKLSQIGNSPTF